MNFNLHLLQIQIFIYELIEIINFDSRDLSLKPHTTSYLSFFRISFTLLANIF